MKKFIALGAALMVLLFSFAANANVTMAKNEGIQVCSDIKPQPEPYNHPYL